MTDRENDIIVTVIVDSEKFYMPRTYHFTSPPEDFLNLLEAIETALQRSLAEDQTTFTEGSKLKSGGDGEDENIH